MIKTVLLLVLTIIAVYFGLTYASEIFDIPRSQIFAWTGIMLGVYLIERFLKYLIQLPFKLYFEELRRNVLAKGVQDTGLTLAYISFWLAIGFTPINGLVNGVTTELTFSNPLFLKIALVLFLATLLFSVLWWISFKLKR